MAGANVLSSSKVLIENCTVFCNLKTIMEEGKFERKEGKVPNCSICYLSFVVRLCKLKLNHICIIRVLRELAFYFSGALIFFTFTIYIFLSKIPDEYRLARVLRIKIFSLIRKCFTKREHAVKSMAVSII